jgi:hypothetical protein
MGKVVPLGTSETSIWRGENHVTHHSVQEDLRYDASSSNRVMNNIYGVSPRGTVDSHGNRANLNCFGSRLWFLRRPIHYGPMIPNFIEVLIKVNWCHRILVPIVIWGICNVSGRIILEYMRELRRLNLFFLQYSRFGRRLSRRIIGCAGSKLKFVY